jgi:membrane associated rhomboid family serine protease
MKTLALHISRLQDPVTLFLMLSLLLFALASYRYKSLRIKLILHPVSIVKDREYYRLLTSDLIHHDFLHLALNELLLYTYGGHLEDYLNRAGAYGSFLYAGIYLVSCLLGAVFSTIVHRNEFGFSSAGASGSLMGCMFSYILLKPKQIALYLPLVGPINNLYFGLLCILLLIVYQLRSKNELINHEQHFFGALGGIITTLLLFPGLI